jgi:hypothetical protein
VVYNNKYDRTQGWVKTSSASAQKSGDAFVQYNLREGLGLSGDGQAYTIFRDHINGLEYIRKNGDLAHNGLFVELDGFKYHVFLDFRQVFATAAKPYDHLTGYLNGRGVPNIEEALRELILGPVHQPFQRLVGDELDTKTSRNEARIFIKEVCRFTGIALPESLSFNLLTVRLDIIREYKQIVQKLGIKKGKALHYLETHMPAKPLLKSILVLRELGNLFTELPAMHIIALIDELHLDKQIRENITGEDSLLLLKALILLEEWFDNAELNLRKAFDVLLQIQEVRDYIQVNRYQEVLYCNKERLETLLGSLLVYTMITTAVEDKKGITRMLNKGYKVVQKILKTANTSGYSIDLMNQELGK